MESRVVRTYVVILMTSMITVSCGWIAPQVVISEDRIEGKQWPLTSHQRILELNLCSTITTWDASCGKVDLVEKIPPGRFAMYCYSGRNGAFFPTWGGSSWDVIADLLSHGLTIFDVWEVWKACLVEECHRTRNDRRVSYDCEKSLFWGLGL